MVLTFNVRAHCEMFRFAQHDILSIIIYVILSVAKNLSVGANVECPYVYVILSVAKNLSVSANVECPCSLRDVSLSLNMTGLGNAALDGSDGGANA